MIEIVKNEDETPTPNAGLFQTAPPSLLHRLGQTVNGASATGPARVQQPPQA